MSNYQKCETCKFWGGKDALVGTCRRNPPVIIDALVAGRLKTIGTVDLQLVTQFPLTPAALWCGEWRAKLEAV